jgi:hypothetical protein
MESLVLWSLTVWPISVNTVLKCSLYSLESELLGSIIFAVLRKCVTFYPDANYKVLIKFKLIYYINYGHNLHITALKLKVYNNFLGAICKNHEQQFRESTISFAV